jgi:hypothetical protein
MSRPRPSIDDRRQRTQIAAAAARLIAENGIYDYALATRKAAESLGVPAGVQLPESAEVEAELRLFQRLYLGEEQSARITDLRLIALAWMERLERFRPYLAGPVLDGSAGRFAEIDIQLFPESSKDVEIFLLSEKIAYAHSVPRSRRAEAVLTLSDDAAVVNLIVYSSHVERVAPRSRGGSPRERANLDAVRRLLATGTP